MCVLRSEGKNKYDVKAFDVYCPKIIATREAFRDRALESRCLTEEMENKNDLREDIPHNLPDSFWEEATAIRNKLLYWRFVNYKKKNFRPELSDRTIEPRLDQIIAPLISIIENPATVEKIKQLVVEYNKKMISDRGMDMEVQVLECILELLRIIPPQDITMKRIADEYNSDISNQNERISAKKVGWVVREKLRLQVKPVRKGHVLSESNTAKIESLKKKFGISDNKEDVSDAMHVSKEF